MIIVIPNENSIVKWKNDEKDEWKVAEISDLIKAYERPKVTVFAENASKEEIEDFKQELENVLERPHGEWILNEDENPECPFCHHSYTWFGNFCSNCGADMRQKQ